MSIMSRMLVKTGKKVAVGAVKDFAGTTLTNVAVKSTSRLLGIDEGIVDRILEAGIPSMIFAGLKTKALRSACLPPRKTEAGVRTEARKSRRSTSSMSSATRDAR